MERTFIRKEVERITGLPARRIQFYTDNAGFVDMKEKSPGRGYERRYTKENILVLLIVRELDLNGVALKRVKEVMDDVKTKFPEILDPKTYEIENPTGAYLVVYPDSYSIIGDRDPETLRASSKPRIDMSKNISAIVININNLHKKLAVL